MLDENLPTYRFQPSSDCPLNTLLYFTHSGSDPEAEYVLKRPIPSTSRSQYAIGLFDASYEPVVYAEVLVTPVWTQPTLSAAEIRAQNGATPPAAPLVPDAFSISLYNPDQAVSVQHVPGKWGKHDSWEFEMPERSFRLPSGSQIDRDSGHRMLETAPKVVFRWKRDGLLSRDMTCYMTGRNVGGRRSKEPDITVAMFRAGKGDCVLCVYEPNMARVEVEDRKGLEVVLLLSAEVIRDLFLGQRQDPFNTAGATPPASSSAAAAATPPRPGMGASGGVVMSGALADAKPVAGPAAHPLPSPSQPFSNGSRADIDAETRRLKAMVAEEERQNREREERLRREREKRDRDEQKRIKKMLEAEEKERQRRQAEVDKETERLRKQYGVPPSRVSPSLPPRQQQQQHYFGPPGSWFGPPNMPPRPNSVGPAHPPAPPRPDDHGGGYGWRRNPQSNLVDGPNAGPAAGAGGFYGSSSRAAEEQQRKKVYKKRSVHF